MQLPHQVGALAVGQGLHGRLGERAIEPVIDLGDAGRGGEALVVFLAVAAERADVVERARLQTEQILAVDQVGMGGIVVDLGDHGLVQAGRQEIDHLHARGELGMLLGRHLARDEDAEMADRLVQRVDDGLAVGDDLVVVLVEIGDPAQRLLRRRDVVAPRAQHDDRRADVAQVDAHAAGRVDLARGELVADEEVVGDPLHLAGVEQDRAAPPGLEVEEARRFGVDLGIEAVGLLPVGVGRIERFEIGHQVGAVEDAVAEVAGQRRQPGAAQHAAEIAHRIACRARPPSRRAANRRARSGRTAPAGSPPSS